MDRYRYNNLLAAVVPPMSEFEFKIANKHQIITRPSSVSRQVEMNYFANVIIDVYSDVDIISILNPNFNSLDETNNYSFIDTSVGHGVGHVHGGGHGHHGLGRNININKLQWDHQTGNYLASIDDNNTVVIWEIGESIQSWNLVEKLTLRMPFVLFSWFQIRQDV